MSSKQIRVIEAVGLLLLLAVALFSRLWQLDAVPPGFQFDEAIDLKISLDIVNGTRPLYLSEGWGREGLFYYLAALVLQVVDSNPVALRTTAVLWSMGVLIFAYLLARYWHSRLAAWLTVAWLTFTYWPLSSSRFGFRHMSLVFMMGLTAWVLWWLWEQKQKRWFHFAILGLCMGLTLYTYQPSRFTPFIFAAFVVYLFLFHRQEAQATSRLWLISLIAFILAIVPLVLVLNQVGSLETGQRGFTIEPLTELLAGNLQPVVSNSWATLKAFTISGDRLKSYNVPGRPIFVPAWTGIFFYAGLLLAIKRWRNPIYAFVLLWLLFTLLPTIVTISAPNFNRMAAAQVPVMFLAAVPLAEISRWLARRYQQMGYALGGLLIAATFIPLANATRHDYFEVWPSVTTDVHTLNREIFAVATYLQTEPDTRPAVISSRDIADEDPYIVSVVVEGETAVRRWVDTSQTLAFPAGVDETRLITTSDRWIDQTLLNLSGMSGTPLYQEDAFTVFGLERGNWLVAAATPLYLPPETAVVPIEQAPQSILTDYPHAFCAHCGGDANEAAILLTGLTVHEPAEAGQPLELITTWETITDQSLASLALFVHLLDSSGEIVTQFDGLGYPPHTWQRGDQFLQIGRLPLAPDLPADTYWLQFGLYDRATGQRWLLLNASRQAVADRLLLAPFVVENGRLIQQNAN